MEFVPLKSSSIESIGHDGDVLEVVFRNGSRYRYTNVPRDVYEALLGAKSPGKAFAQLVRGQGPFERIDQPQEEETE